MAFSGNPFDMLGKHDSDDKNEPRPLTKKQRRAKDQRLRQAHGDRVVKDPYASKGPKKTYPKRAGNREYDRRSGTG